MRTLRATTAALLLALLTACGPLTPGGGAPTALPGAGADAVGTAPRDVDALAPEISVDRWLLPSSWEGAVAVDPSWDRVVDERDGIAVGIAVRADGAAELSAVDAEGRIRWSSTRPAGHVEVGLSTVDGTSVVVLTDPAADGGTTASGYDLASGEPLWGPVEAPGPVVGPGLTLGAAGEDGTAARVALDATSGTVVAEGPQVAESDGWVLTPQDGELVGLAPADRSAPAWTVRADSLGLTTDAVPLTATAPPGTVLLGEDGGSQAGTLVEVADGRPVATRVTAAAVDSATGTRVAIGAGGVSGHGPDGPLWSRPAPDGTEIAAVGGALVYLREGDAVRVLNALTGAEAIAYEGDRGEGYVVPTMVTSAGSAVARTDRLVVLTTGGGPSS